VTSAENQSNDLSPINLASVVPEGVDATNSHQECIKEIQAILAACKIERATIEATRDDVFKMSADVAELKRQLVAEKDMLAKLKEVAEVSAASIADEMLLITANKEKTDLAGKVIADASASVATLKAAVDVSAASIADINTTVATTKGQVTADAKSVADLLASLTAMKAAATADVKHISDAAATLNATTATVEGNQVKATQAVLAIATALEAVSLEQAKATAAAATIESAKTGVEADAKSTKQERLEVEKARLAINTANEAIQLVSSKIDELKAVAQATASAMNIELDGAKNIRAVAQAAVEEVNSLKQQMEIERDQVSRLGTQVEAAQTKADEAAKNAEESSAVANAEAKRAQEAHNLSTTAGLAGAFNQKAQESKKRGGLWALALGLSLVAAAGIGIFRFQSLTEFIVTKPQPLAMAAEVVLAFLGVGPLVWGAWVATRMVSKSFALTEDYAYKAALSKAYVGFREEAKHLGDPIFEQRLFAAAVTQLDANPVRLLDASHPGSPLQDLLQQPFIQQAMTEWGFKRALVEWFNARFKTKIVLPQESPPPPPSQFVAQAVGVPPATVPSVIPAAPQLPVALPG